jgi:hypothetical protein
MTENEKKSLDTLTIEMDGVDYVMQGGGGLKPGVPIPADTVDSDAIVDGAVEMEDLNDDVKKNMTHSYDSEGEGIVLGGLVGNQNG